VGSIGGTVRIILTTVAICDISVFFVSNLNSFAFFVKIKKSWFADSR